MDAGDRVKPGAVTEGLGWEIFQIYPPRSPLCPAETFSKGGSYFGYVNFVVENDPATRLSGCTRLIRAWLKSMQI